jgi:Na+-translocating ferredoxin:NAD+ oxidoreductase RnfD subunit
MARLLAYVKSHRKALVAYAAALVTVLAVALPHTSPWYAVVIAVASALGVHAIPNEKS